MKRKIILYIIILFFSGIVVVWKSCCDYETKKYENIKQMQELSKHNQSTIDSIMDSISSQPCPFCSDTVWRDSLRKK